MFKLPITYMTFSGEEKTKDFYFNLTKAEIAEIHFSLPGGLDGFMERFEEEPNAEGMIEVFKKLILKSYGKRTAEGKFLKSKELSEEFSATDAYSELFLKLLENKDDFVNKFIAGVTNIPEGAFQQMLLDNPKIEAAEKALTGDF